MYLNTIFSTSVALLITVTSAAPVEEGFIDSTSVTASTTPAGFNLTHVETHQPNGQNGDTNYTVAFHIADSAAQTDCNITWPATAAPDAEKYNECNNITFTASITSFTNISSFALDLDHYYANEHSNIAHGNITSIELGCAGTVGASEVEAQCCQPNNTVIILSGGTGVSG